MSSQLTQPIRHRVNDILVSSGLARLFGGIFVGRVLAAVAQAGTLILLARALGPKDFAVVSGVLGLLVFASSVIDFGVTSATTRAVATQASAQVKRLRFLNLWCSAFGALLFSFGLLMYGASLGTGVGISLALLGVWAGVDRLAEIRLAVLIGSKKGRAVVANLALRRVVALAAVVAAYLWWPQAIVAALAVGSIVGSILVVSRTRMRDRVESHVAGRVDASDKDWRLALRESLPFWVNSMAAQSRQLDVIVVGWVSGSVAAAAAYAPVSRLVSPLRLLPTTFAQASLAVASSRPGRRNESLGLTALAVLPSLALFTIVGVFANYWVPALLGQEYAPSVPILQVVLFGLVFAAATSVQTSLLQARGHEKTVAIVSVITGGLALVLVAVGTGIGGGVGAGVGLTVGYALQSLALAWASFRENQQMRKS
jgi:O-antigen/teichoic acid export membrane protein